MQLHATIGKLSGELLRDLADALLLPFSMSDYSLYLRHMADVFRDNATVEINRCNLNMSKC